MNIAMKEYAYTGLEIAIIGIAAKFPGADDVRQFWNNLCQGVESISNFTRQELIENGIETVLLDQPGYVYARGMIQGIEYFDASFFGYTPHEAMVMDPQLRFVHHCAWEALEDAACDPYTFAGSIGVYMGFRDNLEWRWLGFMQGEIERSAGGIFSLGMLVNKDLFCSRLAYQLNLTGPCNSVNSGCSTSLLAIHNACRGLLGGECDIALAGGVSLVVPQRQGYLYREGMIESPDGHCRAFDRDANGTVPGSGGAVVVLKRLEDALANHHSIYAIIKGSAVNNDGKRKIGFTAPSVAGQIEVISAAYRMAEVNPKTISFIETHGTGTVIGDSIEIKALSTVMKRDDQGHCILGAVKTNIGHLDAASGMASFIKTILVLHHRIVPPTLHFRSPHPELHLENTPFSINTSRVPLQHRVPVNESIPFRAAVHSYGIGGTNVHMIVEELPTKNPGENRQHTINQNGNHNPEAAPYYLLVLSARSEKALEQMSQNLAEYLQKNPGTSLDNVVYTLQTGRAVFSYRRFLVCTSIEQAIYALRNKDTVLGKRMTADSCQSPPMISPEIQRMIDEKIPLLASPLASSIHSKNFLDRASFLTAIGELWLYRNIIDWKPLYGDAFPFLLHLPTYPFEAARYWPATFYQSLVSTRTEESPDTVKKNETGDNSKNLSLPVHPRPPLITPYVSPLNEIEKKLVEIWQHFFGLDRVGIDDHFFDLGGDSLKAGVMISKLQDALGIHIPLSEFLQVLTIRDLGRLIAQQGKEPQDRVQPVEQAEYYPLSYNQERLWILQELEPGSPAYNIAEYLVLEGTIKKEVLWEIIYGLQVRHEAFRTGFKQVDDQPVQWVIPVEQAILPIHFLERAIFPGDEFKEDSGKISQLFFKEISKPFNLKSPPLYRVTALQLNPGRFVLVFTMHHIISDGWSMEILKTDLLSLYSAYTRGKSEGGSVLLPPTAIQYRDFACWQQLRLKDSQYRESAHTSWMSKIDKNISSLSPSRLPRDFEEVKTGHDSAGYRLVLAEPLHKDILSLAIENKTTPFVLLVSLFNIILSRMTAREDVLYAILGAGRNDTVLHEIIGFFVNTLLFKYCLNLDEPFPNYLHHCNQEIIEILQYQDYPLELIFEELQVPYPKFSILFNMLNLDIDPLKKTKKLANLESGHSPWVPDTKFELVMQVSNFENALEILCFYRKNLYKKDKIEYFMQQYKNIIKKVISDPGQPLNHYLHEKKKRILLIQ